MNLNKTGMLIRELRKSKNLTQKQLADMLGILPKIVSKWETGNGFPDVSALSSLADILGVSERILLCGDLVQNTEVSGNMKRIKFFVCPHCGSIMQGVGESTVVCCGKTLEALKSQLTDAYHSISVSDIENDFFIEINHPMTKEHYISFVVYAGFDRVMMVRMYPEQDSTVRIPKMFRGKIYFYCTKHGLFEYKI